MKFELNKFYKHTAGKMMHVMALAKSPIMWMGPTLLAEDLGGMITPCGMDEVSAQNWVEIDESEYMDQLF